MRLLLLVSSLTLASCITPPPGNSATGSDGGRETDDGHFPDVRVRDMTLDPDRDATTDQGGDAADATDADDVPDVPIACPPITLMPVARWAMDAQTSGTVANETNGGEPGLIRDGSFLGAGRFGQALIFTDAPSSTRIPHRPMFELDQGSISIWVRPSMETIGAPIAGIFSKDANGSVEEGHLTLWFVAGAIEVRQQTLQDQGFATSPANLTADQWHHVVATWQEGLVELYINGVLVDDTSDTNHGWSMAGNTEPIAIGSDASESSVGAVTPVERRFIGRLDELNIFDQVLNVDDVAALGQGCGTGI